MLKFFKVTDCKRKLLWVEVLPSIIFKAVALGKKRKIFFITQYLIIYRDDIDENRCVVEWISESSLVERIK